MKATARPGRRPGTITVRSTAGGRTKTTTVPLRDLPSPEEEAAAREAYLHERYHKVADAWNDYLDRLARGEDPFGAKIRG